MTKLRSRLRRSSRSNPCPRGEAAAIHRQQSVLQKILARAGLASRSEAEEWIRAEGSPSRGTGDPGQQGAGQATAAPGRPPIHKAGQSALATDLPGHRVRTHRPEGGTETSARQRPQCRSQRLSRRVGRRYSPSVPCHASMAAWNCSPTMASSRHGLQRAVRSMPLQFSLRIRGELSAEQLDGIMEGTVDSGERPADPGLRAHWRRGGSNRWYQVDAMAQMDANCARSWSVRVPQSAGLLRVAMGGLQLERTLGVAGAATGAMRSLRCCRSGRLLAVQCLTVIPNARGPSRRMKGSVSAQAAASVRDSRTGRPRANGGTGTSGMRVLTRIAEVPSNSGP